MFEGKISGQVNRSLYIKEFLPQLKVFSRDKKNLNSSKSIKNICVL